MVYLIKYTVTNLTKHSVGTIFHYRCSIHRIYLVLLLLDFLAALQEPHTPSFDFFVLPIRCPSSIHIQTATHSNSLPACVIPSAPAYWPPIHACLRPASPITKQQNTSCWCNLMQVVGARLLSVLLNQNTCVVS